MEKAKRLERKLILETYNQRKKPPVLWVVLILDKGCGSFL
jgi:hypothetical protein